MIPNNFEYFAPATIEDAVSLLGKYGEECKVLSGGQSLIPILKLRLAAPGAVVDIGRIKELGQITVDGDTIRIGANVTHAEIAASAILREACPLLVETAAQIGDPQVRNRGTIGGSLTHADPAADWPAAILALEGEIVARNRLGERVIKVQDFFIDLLTSAVSPHEIVTEIRLTRPAQPGNSAYLKVPQAASGFAVIGVAVQLTINNGLCETAAIGVTGLAPKAYRAASTEALLIGKPLDDLSISAAAAKADADTSDAMEDIHASGDYRRHLSRIFTRRAIHMSVKK
ncbi:MAG: xanthine dehydrogenase family protein subunit M [Acidobacteria bacterium]|nr:xanthine dehydrogenase family protein subunit M [Acidobacteriota bacterium]